MQGFLDRSRRDVLEAKLFGCLVYRLNCICKQGAGDSGNHLTHEEAVNCVSLKNHVTSSDRGDNHLTTRQRHVWDGWGTLDGVSSLNTGKTMVARTSHQCNVLRMFVFPHTMLK
jgi:hypothetical protein